MAHDPREPKRKWERPGWETPTRLADIKDTNWAWLYCRNGPHCHHYASVRYADLIERYGQDITLEQLRFNARCTACGHLGALTKMPSWTASGWAKFPEEHDAKRKWN